MNTIKAGDKLTARAAGDHECIFEAEVIERSKSFVTVKIMGRTVRTKVHVYEECEFIYALGRYSMAPIFRANSN